MLGGELDRAAREFSSRPRDALAVQDHVNLPYALATGAALAAVAAMQRRAGTLWGAVEGIADRELSRRRRSVIAEYRPRVEPVQGEEFERACSEARTSHSNEAVDYALAPRLTADGASGRPA